MAQSANIINFVEWKLRRRPSARPLRPAWQTEAYTRRAREAQRRSFERFMARFGPARLY